MKKNESHYILDEETDDIGLNVRSWPEIATMMTKKLKGPKPLIQKNDVRQAIESSKKRGYKKTRRGDNIRQDTYAAWRRSGMADSACLSPEHSRAYVSDWKKLSTWNKSVYVDAWTFAKVGQ